MIKFTFAPVKIFKDIYGVSSAAPTAYELADGTKFERYAVKALSKPLSDIYKNSDLQLVGYSYKQYDKNGWSYYPTQFFVDGEYKGICWLKWRFKDGGYFALCDKPIANNEKKIAERFPDEIKLCTDEEAKELRQYEHQVRTDLLNSENWAGIHPAKCGFPENVNPTFYYELLRQLSGDLTAISACPTFGERAVIFFPVFSEIVKYNDWYYTTMDLKRQPDWADEETSDLLVYYRFKSLSGLEITPFDEFGSDNILFELCVKKPPVELEHGALSYPICANKLELREFLSSAYVENKIYEEKLQKVIGESFVFSFSVAFESISINKYPNIMFWIKFKSAKSPENQTELIDQAVRLAKQVGIRSSITAAPENWGNFRSDSYMYLYLNLDTAGAHGLVELVRLIDKNIKGVKSVKIEAQGDFSSAFNEALNPELYRKNLTEMHKKEGYYRFRSYIGAICFPDVLMKITSDIEKEQLTTFINESIEQLSNILIVQIKLIEKPMELSDNTLLFEFDFGNAEKNALWTLLDLFEKSELNITRVDVF